MYKGKNEEEIKKEFNQRWIEILNCCSLKSLQKFYNNTCKESDKHDTINSTAINACSTQKEWNKYEK